jgi:hypothetical protein
MLKQSPEKDCLQSAIWSPIARDYNKCSISWNSYMTVKVGESNRRGKQRETEPVGVGHRKKKKKKTPVCLWLQHKTWPKKKKQVLLIRRNKAIL